MPTLHPHPDDHPVRDARSSDHAALQPCHHPAERRYAWFARDDTQPGGDVLVITCCDCGQVLQGAADEVSHDHGQAQV